MARRVQPQGKQPEMGLSVEPIKKKLPEMGLQSEPIKEKRKPRNPASTNRKNKR